MVPTTSRNLGYIEKFLANEQLIQKAFGISTLALLLLAPLSLILGAAIGLAAHHYIDPNLKLKAADKAIPLPHALLAVIGASAAAICLLPGSFLGGPLLKALPLIASGAIGSAAYRAIKSV